MTCGKLLRERKPFSRLCIHIQTILAAHILHMDAVFLSASQQPSVMALSLSWHIKPVQNPPKARCLYEIPHFSAQ